MDPEDDVGSSHENRGRVLLLHLLTGLELTMCLVPFPRLQGGVDLHRPAVSRIGAEEDPQLPRLRASLANRSCTLETPRSLGPRFHNRKI